MRSMPTSENETKTSHVSAVDTHFVRKTRALQQVARSIAGTTDLQEALRILGSTSETPTDKERCATAMALVEQLITELDLLTGLGWLRWKPLSPTTTSTTGPEKN